VQAIRARGDSSPPALWVRGALSAILAQLHTFLSDALPSFARAQSVEHLPIPQTEKFFRLTFTLFCAKKRMATGAPEKPNHLQPSQLGTKE
jgi:hypothetical protein